MERPLKGGWFLHNRSLLLSMAVLNSPTRPLGHIEGHLQYRRYLPRTTTSSLPAPCSLLSPRSHGLICATVSFDPTTTTTTTPFLHMQTLQYFILIRPDEITSYCSCLVYSVTDLAGGRESRVTHHLASNCPSATVL